MCIPPGFTDSSRPPEPTQVSDPTSIVEIESTPIPVPTAADEPPSIPEVGNGQLNEQGPWLLISTNIGLWAINPDGTGLTGLAQHNLSWQRLQNAIQPNGSTLAVITSDETQLRQLALNLVTLPDGKLQKITNLTSPKTELSPNSSPGDPEFEAVRAITERNSIAWSPDGSRLAFIGFMDGPAANVYLYDTHTQKIKRVSQDNINNYDVSWSPDGQYILYFGAEFFGTGAGMEVKGVWIASSDGSKTSLLYKPTDSSGEELLGWLPNSHQALLSSWNMVCGSKNLRLMDVENGQISPLNKDCFQQAAISELGDILIGNGETINLIKNGSSIAKPVIEGQANQLLWSQDSTAFIVRYGDGQLMTYVDNQGEVYQEKAPQSGLQSVATYGAIWAWSSYDEQQPGVWISGPGLDTQQIYEGRAYAPAWDPHNNLLFFGENQIYHASYPAYMDVAGVAIFEESVQEVKWVEFQ
jgi:WD40 repeat protein